MVRLIQKQMRCSLLKCKLSKEAATLLSVSSCNVIFSFMLISIININFHSINLFPYIVKHLSPASLSMLSGFLLVHINDSLSKRFVLRVCKVGKKKSLMEKAGI